LPRAQRSERPERPERPDDAASHLTHFRLPERTTAAVGREQLLTTKLFPPNAAADIVLRPRLAEQLAGGDGCRLTLISAPAGYGKTTLLSAWAAASGLPVAWVSLDEDDNDPTRFWAYVIAALLGVRAANDKAPAIADLADVPPAPSESAITAIINAFADAPQPVALVLDDYHVIESAAVHRALTFFLEHLPAQLRLVVASRVDPPLPLARLRARGQLVELRAGDLRFTAAESAAFLNANRGLNLPLSDIAILEDRTDGWIAGLRLAAQALARHDDSAGFIAAFGGSHRSVVDYFGDEALASLPSAMLDFLLRTSILERMNAELCDALTGSGAAREALEWLERANLFVVALDDERRWYRYHPLFADVLRAKLRQTRAADERELHGRAAAWFNAHGFAREALNHAFAARDTRRAIALLKREASPLLLRGEFATVLAWLDQLPGPQVRCDSVLCRIRCWALIYTGRIREAEPWLQFAALGCWITTPAAVRAEILSLRASAARFAGQGREAVQLSHEALELIPEWNQSMLGITQINLAAAYGMLDDLDAADRALDAADLHAYASADPCLTVIASAHRAFIQHHRGYLRAAERLYREALRIATAGAGPPFPAASYAYLGLGEIAYERHELDLATRRLLDGITLGEGGRFNLSISCYQCLARVKQAQGRSDEADEALAEAQSLAEASGVAHLIASVESRRVQTWLEQGRLREAEHWARTRPDDIPLSTAYRDDGQDITVARVWLAQGRRRQAAALLARLLDVARAAGRVAHSIELLALQAVAQAGLGEQAAALAALRQALELAEPDGYVRSFVEAGPELAPLLTRLLEERRRGLELGGPSSAYLRKLLTAFEPATAPAATPSAPAASPLSARELEVVRCIAAGASNQQIAAELFISVGTVKRHLHNIYAKLDASSRTQAIVRARALGLVED
jgi:LuxR family maltose regulon positive regulatory protein